MAFASSLVLAQSTFAHGEGCKSMHKMMESLKLDSAQKDKIKPIMEQMKASKKDNWSQMKDLETQMNQQAMSPTMDQATVDSLIDKKTKLIGNMMKAKITAQNQIFAILNADQKTKLTAMMKKMDEEMAEKFKNCHDD